MQNRRMTPEQTAQLFERYQATGDPAIRDEILVGHLYIASFAARRFVGRGVEYDDLFQIASLAMLKAFERYDPARGIRFATFITPTITGELQNHFRDRASLIRLPRRNREIAARVGKAREQLEQSLGRSVRVSELSEATGYTEAEILEALELASSSPVSLDAAPEGEDDASTLAHILGTDEAGYRRFEDRETLRALLSLLTEEDRTLLTLRYVDELSQRRVAEQLGISQMTVSRRETRALAALREHLK